MKLLTRWLENIENYGTYANAWSLINDELGYLAGVFDGEGTFGIWSKGKNKTRQLRVAVDMSDGDTVLRFLTFFFSFPTFSLHTKKRFWMHFLLLPSPPIKRINSFEFFWANFIYSIDGVHRHFPSFAQNLSPLRPPWSLPDNRM